MRVGQWTQGSVALDQRHPAQSRCNTPLCRVSKKLEGRRYAERDEQPGGYLRQGAYQGPRDRIDTRRLSEGIEFI